MYGGLGYVATFSNVTITNAGGDTDIFTIQAPSDAAICITSCEIMQHSDFGDAAAEIIGWTAVRGHGTVSITGGTAATEEPLMKGYPAAGGVVTYNHTTRMAAGTGSLHVIGAGGWNVALGVPLKPIPEEMVWVSPSDYWTIGIITGPADDLSVSGEIKWYEFGG